MVDVMRRLFLKQVMRGSQAVGIIALSLVAAAGIGGCAGGIHLHNPADADLSKKAGDAFKAADVAGIIDAQRKAVAAANERDIAVTRANLAAQRDAAIVSSLSGRAERAVQRLDARLRVIGFPADATVQKQLFDLPRLRRDTLTLRDAYLTKVALANPPIPFPAFPPTPADAEAANKTNDQTVILMFKSYNDAAKLYFETANAVNQTTSGLLSDVTNKISQSDSLLHDLQRARAARRDALKKAVTAYETEAKKPSSPNLVNLRQDVETALAGFDQAAANLRPQAKSIGLEDALAGIDLERLQAVRAQLAKYLSAFSAESASAEGNADSAGSDTDVFGRTASILAKTSKEVQDASSRVRLVPLAFEQERLRLESVRAERAVERGERRLALYERRRESLIAEGRKVLDARNTLARAGASDTNLSVDALVSASDPKIKGAAMHALFVWAEAIAIDRMRGEEADMELIALDHDQALDASDLALGLWAHMISAPLNELVAYHASGLTSEDIGNLIHAIGLGGIAVGVNR